MGLIVSQGDSPFQRTDDSRDKRVPDHGQHDHVPLLLRAESARYVFQPSAVKSSSFTKSYATLVDGRHDDTVRNE